MFTSRDEAIDWLNNALARQAEWISEVRGSNFEQSLTINS